MFSQFRDKNDAVNEIKKIKMSVYQPNPLKNSFTFDNIILFLDLESLKTPKMQLILSFLFELQHKYSSLWLPILIVHFFYIFVWHEYPPNKVDKMMLSLNIENNHCSFEIAFQRIPICPCLLPDWSHISFVWFSHSFHCYWVCELQGNIDVKWVFSCC